MEKIKLNLPIDDCKSKTLREDNNVSAINFQEIKTCSADGAILELVPQ